MAGVLMDEEDDMRRSGKVETKSPAANASKSPLGWHKAAESHMAPVKRRGHSAVVHMDRIAVFGGWHGGQTVKDMWYLNTQTFRWTRCEPQTAAATPAGRMGHTATVYKDFMYIFGGEAGTHCMNDLWRFSFVDEEWEKIKFDDNARLPSARYGHAACQVGSRIIVFGGADRFPKATDDPSFFEDLWVFDCDDGRWQQIPTRGPEKRYGHSLTLVDDRIYMFGGFGASGRMNDLWRLDPTSFAWTQLQSPGAWPYRRCNHSAVSIGAKLVMFGGLGASGLQDLWEFDPEEKKWQRWDMKRHPRALEEIEKSNIYQPGARHDHAAAVVDGKMLLFGGVADGNFLYGDLWYLATTEDTGAEQKAQADRKNTVANLSTLSSDAFIAEVANLIHKQQVEFGALVDTRVDQRLAERAPEDARLRAEVENLRRRVAVERSKRLETEGALAQQVERQGVMEQANEARLIEIQHKLGIETEEERLASSNGGPKLTHHDRLAELEEANADMRKRLDDADKEKIALNQQMVRLRADLQLITAKVSGTENSGVMSKMNMMENAIRELDERTKRGGMTSSPSVGGGAGGLGGGVGGDAESRINATLAQRQKEDLAYRKTQFENLKKLHAAQKKGLKDLEDRLRAGGASIAPAAATTTTSDQGSAAASGSGASAGGDSARIAALEKRVAALENTLKRVSLALKNEVGAQIKKQNADIAALRKEIEDRLSRGNNARDDAKYAIVHKKISETLDSADNLQDTIREFQTEANMSRQSSVRSENGQGLAASP